MLTKDYKDDLQLLEVYFPEISFSYDKDADGEMELKIRHGLTYFTNSADPDLHRVVVETEIRDMDEKRLAIELKTVGIFRLNPGLDEDRAYNLTKYNTVATLFPYIRGKVTELTTQPGLNPYYLPIVDITKLVDDVLDNT